ncbi:hypothetical protein I7V28_05690 [Lelliottia amnigena]|uniref:hypothetical protein n=1 Tax=Lelliottia amnigena TaxID=61646 RepID=UPI00192B116C|nr:hypothetical protein [Lelliottia amnigena]ELN2578451.1 hypothetical protein [Enterobacter kobei]MBL5920619.1 hypothetical protein [Lelliottia amnigena]
MGTFILFIVIGLILFLVLKKFSPDMLDEHSRKRNDSTKRIIEAEHEKARLYDERKRNTPKAPAPPKPTRKQRPPKKALNGLPLKITYEDGAGDVTVRDISVIEYDSSSQKTYAWCYARNDFRSFFTYRMLEVIDTSTGEDIKDIDSHLDEAFKFGTKNNLTH